MPDVAHTELAESATGQLFRFAEEPHDRVLMVVETTTVAPTIFKTYGLRPRVGLLCN
jgi:hypothetical protein